MKNSSYGNNPRQIGHSSHRSDRQVIGLVDNWIWIETMKGKTALDHCKIGQKIRDYDQEIKGNDH